MTMLNGSRACLHLVLVTVLAFCLLLPQTSPLAAQTVFVPEATVSTNSLIYDRRTGNTQVTLTVTNTGGETLAAPFTVEISDVLPATAQIVGYSQDAGTWRVPFASDLAAGASTSLQLVFTNTDRNRLTYMAMVTQPDTANTPPVANAGPDATVTIGVTAQLDGTGSSDADSDPLTYAWQIVSRPAGSAATLAGAATAQPSLTPDVDGTYVVQLVVNDGTEDSAPDTVSLTTGNAAPVANAGPDVTVTLGQQVTLSGAASTDPNGDALSYAWLLVSGPAGTAVPTTGSDVSFVFSPDQPGTYVYQLTVSDGDLSASDTVSVAVGVDQPPVAEAGTNMRVDLGEVVMLDGSGSSDPEGAILTYAWALISAPAGSTANFDDPGLPMPSFTVDLPGTYVAQLIVNDGANSSAPDTVTISTSNVPPTADAGPDQTVALAATVTLDGSGSSDVDGDLLTYLWSFTSRPAGSVAALSDTSAVMPTFVADRAGTYVLQLAVSDGIETRFDTVSISTLNTPPVADAGPDQSDVVGATIQFDGRGSSDADGDPLTYAWSLTTRPAGSEAVLARAASATPSLELDYPGTYVARLIVNDGQTDSAADTVTVTTINSRPVADAGDNADFFAGEVIALNGLGSSDADFDALTYAWSIISAPAGSTAAVAAPTAGETEFRPDLVGTYVAQLIVNDGALDSTPDTATFTVTAPVALLSASPLVGAAPVNVTLFAEMVGGFEPYTYLWDNGVTLQGYNRTFATPGTYDVSVTITDSAGYVAQQTQTVTVLIGPTVEADADPVSGTAPLTVSFSGVAADADGSVVRYQWDFADDGSFDYSDGASASTQFTYSAPGLYVARLRVTDNDGLSTDDTVTIAVGEPPILDASVAPLTGTAPLEVTYTASATDPDGTVVRYEWDFEGDGIVDFISAANGNTTHTYTEGGVYSATARVFDNDGLLAERSFIVSVAGPPISEPRAYPTSGEAPLTVTFFASGTDFDGSPEYYDWDYNGDGTRDVRLIASMNSTYTYTTPGTYQAALTVVDDDGLTGVRSVEITVLPATGGGGGLVVEANAVPNNGGAPLPTRLQGRVVSSQAPIASLSWDIDGDGTADFTEPGAETRLLGGRLDNGSYATPDYDDLTGDGAPDLVLGNSSGWLYFYPNMLSGPTTASFDVSADIRLTQTDPGSGNETVIDVGSYAAPLFYDVNGDGVKDLLVGDSNGWIRYFERSGPADAPVWTDRERIVNSGGTIIDVGSYANPAAYDADGDGDLDLIVGDSNGNLRLFRRDGTAAQPIWTDLGLLADNGGVTIDVGSYAAPESRELTGDALADLVVGNSTGQILAYQNTGTASTPVWTFLAILTDGANTLDVGSYAVPSYIDLSGDGVEDLVIGNSSGNLYVYLETGPTATTFVQIYDDLDFGSYAAPTFYNRDGDSDFDLMVGDLNGTLRFMDNIGSNTDPFFRIGAQVSYVISPPPADPLAPTTAPVDVGSYANPTAFDYEGDGDVDFYIGNSSGQVFLLRNIGTPSAEVFEAPVLVTYQSGAAIDVGSYAAPTFFDVTGDGLVDLVVGDSSGNIEVHPNVGTNAVPAFDTRLFLADRFGSTIDVGSYATPIFFDYDGDGTSELFVGDSGGFISLFENVAPGAVQLELVTTDVLGFDVGSYAAPAVADLDADGDSDLIVGNSNGNLYQYLQRGQVGVTYAAAGTYEAVFTATDTAGNSAQATVPVVVGPAGAPTAQLRANLTQGFAPLAVQFTYAGSDPGGTISSFALDLDGDGTVDVTDSAPGATSFTYDLAGEYTATLTVTDNDGLTSTASVGIDVGALLSANLAASSFDPVAGQNATVETQVTGASGEMRVDIVDGQGNLVRRLVDNLSRAPGTYQDLWDGRNNAGMLVRDGAYYVIVSLTTGGETIVYDAREDAVFEELTPSRSFTANFNPYEGIPVEVGYTSPWPAEISLYFWTRDNSRPASTIAPVRTVFLRLPRPAGTYTDVWDGFNDQGVVVAPNQQYPVTLWLYRLPSNTIIVTGNTPKITTIDIVPRYFNPVFNPYSSTGAVTANVTLSIDKPATLVLDILNSEGLSVRRITAPNRASGTNIVPWDGRDSEGNFVAPGSYSIGVVAVDATGNRSLPRYTTTAVRY